MSSIVLRDALRLLIFLAFDHAARVACTDRDERVQVTEHLRQKAGVRETYTRLVLREVQLATTA
ncbi:hypothetical protein [Aquabacterium sp.]|uniref:hypothetical protein n=1 Tax=Aquabacterium sp. TaxID=1872578 RepID=UPI002BB274CA|nr:hypothetical protein [Aquabacterium sp.]HSW07708.1 hypothetical protein [Aquabacterium sp.]